LDSFDRLIKQLCSNQSLRQHPAILVFLNTAILKTPEKPKSSETPQKVANKESKKLVKKFKRMRRHDFKFVEIYDFDEFWRKCQKPLDTINEQGDSVADSCDAFDDLFGDSAVVSAGVIEGDIPALFGYYFQEIAKAECAVELSLTEKFLPTLEITGDRQTIRHIDKFIRTLEKCIEAIASFVTTCPDLVEQVVRFSEECKDFPEKVQEKAPNLSPFQVPAVMKKTSENVKFLGGVPHDFKELYEAIKNFLNILKKCVDVAFDMESKPIEGNYIS